jgi:4a-hydroxytetrahydrobiopterin dehydratase
MESLRDARCLPCRGGEPPLDKKEIDRLKPEIPEWEVIEVENIPRLQRVFKFKNFAQALDFTNKVGGLAEAEDHHPALTTEWGKVTVNWWTHKIRGLHRNDFIMSAKTDGLYSPGF